jgi:hypothetical protein
MVSAFHPERYHAFLLNDVVNEDVPDLETVA